MDSELIGKTTMQLLDHMEGDPKVEGGTIVAVGVVCVVENSEGNQTFTRIWCSDDMYYKQVGLFQTALEVLDYGNSPREESDDE